MKVYLFTIPKAGTYFISHLISQMGFKNTGFHVTKNKRLNTLKFDLSSNARTPSITSENVGFLPTLSEVKDREMAFGHFPAPLMAWMLPEFNFICAYRHPRKTLVSEFVDFRFRRADVPSLSRSVIPDDAEAFSTYLKRRGPKHAATFHRMLAARILSSEPNLNAFSKERFCFVNFERLIEDPTEIIGIARCLRVNNGLNFEEIHARSLAEDTKTRATEIDFDRSSIWSQDAEDQYANLKLDPILHRMTELGLGF